MSEALHIHPESAVGHDVHHNGNGHGHHHHQSFITKYIFSTDHKMIAKQFLITGMIWAIVGGLFSVLFRLQLGYPGQSFPILETFFGHWAEGGLIKPEFYYALVTMHGTILVFFVLTAGLSGTFANLLIPLQVGARDMASPFLNMLSYWFFFMASMVMLASLFVQTGPASGGWTMYPPLSALRQAGDGSKIGADLWLISMALFIVSSLMGGLNYISTILNMRTKGMSMTRLPLPIWALFFTAVLGVLSFPVLLSGAILLLFDRNLGTSFFLSDIVVNGEILPNEGGSAILYPAFVLVPGSPGSIYHPVAGDGNGVGNSFGECKKTHLRLYGDAWFFIRHRYPGVPGMGAPYVCNGIESIPWIGVRVTHPVDRCTVGYQSI